MQEVQDGSDGGDRESGDVLSASAGRRSVLEHIDDVGRGSSSSFVTTDVQVCK